MRSQEEIEYQILILNDQRDGLDMMQNRIIDQLIAQLKWILERE